MVVGERLLKFQMLNQLTFEIRFMFWVLTHEEGYPLATVQPVSIRYVVYFALPIDARGKLAPYTITRQTLHLGYFFMCAR